MTRFADPEVAVADAIVRVPDNALHAPPRAWPPLAHLSPAASRTPRYFVVDCTGGVDRTIDLAGWLRDALVLINKAGLTPKPAIAVLLPRTERRHAQRCAAAGAIISRKRFDEFVEAVGKAIARPLPDANPPAEPLRPPTEEELKKFVRASPAARSLAKFNRYLDSARKVRRSELE